MSETRWNFRESCHDEDCELPMPWISCRCRDWAWHCWHLSLPDLSAAHGRAVNLQRLFPEVEGSAWGRAQNLYPGVSRGTQTAQSLLPDLRLDGWLDSRSASKSVWCRGWVLQRPEFPASPGVDLGGGDVRLGNAAGRHSAFPARSTGSERELNAFTPEPCRDGD